MWEKSFISKRLVIGARKKMFALILILSSLSALASAKKSMMHFDVGKEDAETGFEKLNLYSAV